MDYLIWDKQVSYSVGAEQGVIDAKDAGSLLKGAKKTFCVAVRTQADVITSDSPDPEKVEALALKQFTGDPTLQFELLEGDQYQVFALAQTALADIRESLATERIARLVPYQIALRYFIQEFKMPVTSYTAFLDGRGDSVLLTIFNGQRASGVRDLPTESHACINELVRSLRGYCNERKLQDTVFSVITNNVELRQAIIDLSDQTLIDKNSIALVDDRYPAITAMKQGKDLLEFVLPERLEQEQKEKTAKHDKTLLALGCSLALAGFAFFIFASVQKTVLNNQIAGERKEQIRLSRELDKAYVDKFAAIVKANGFDYGVTYLERFLRRLPDYMFEIKNIELVKNQQLKINLLRGSDLKGDKEYLQKLFPEARIYDTVIMEKSALVVCINWE